MVTRIPIQISALPETSEANETLYALCNDGSIWLIEPLAEGTIDEALWLRLPQIPQPTTEEGN